MSDEISTGAKKLAAIFCWLFDGIKTIPNIFFSSKTKFLYPNITFFLETYVEKFQKYVQFFIRILTSQQIEPISLFSFQVMTSIQECVKISTLSFYVMFNVYIALGETQIAERWQLVSDL